MAKRPKQHRNIVIASPPGAEATTGLRGQRTQIEKRGAANNEKQKPLKKSKRRKNNQPKQAAPRPQTKKHKIHTPGKRVVHLKKRCIYIDIYYKLYNLFPFRFN